MVVLNRKGEALADSGPHPWAPPRSSSGMVVTETMLIEPAEGILFRYAPTLLRFPFAQSEEMIELFSSIRVPMPVPPGAEGGGISDATHSARLSGSDRPAERSRTAIAISDIRVMEPVIAPDGEIVGYVQLSERPNYRAGTLDSIRRALIWAGLAAVAVASAIGLGIGRNLSAPLVSLAAAARRMGTGDLRVRADVKRADEIGDVARQFNVMAERLEESFQTLAADRDALRRFVADAAHELRTPITALKTFNELLLKQGEIGSQTRHGFLKESEAQIDRLDWLTKNLLDLSKLDAGMLELNLSEHDLARLAQHVMLSFRPQAEELGVSLREELPSEPEPVTVDGARMEQVLANLLSNALKFTPNGGSVTVGLASQPDGVALWVQDTGPGIAAEELPLIFDRFYRGAQGHTRGGSGLGLSIVKGIVEAHGGHVGVESLPGQGSRFTLNLPRTRTSEA
jgi:signal transduction histidine kinase